MPRRRIPYATKQQILLEAGYKCGNPVCRHILTLELHHIVWVKDGGGNEPENLLCLCPNCHSLHTAGHIPSGAIRVWKNMLMTLSNPNRAAVDFLLVIAQEEKARFEEEEKDPGAARPSLRFTGDSLPMIAPLITSGLVEIGERYRGTGVWAGDAQPWFEIRLTDHGRQLIGAWQAGDDEELDRVIQPTFIQSTARVFQPSITKSAQPTEDATEEEGGTVEP